MPPKPPRSKRVRFGPTTVVPISPISDSQSSTLVNSQAVSSDLRASVQRALPILGTLDHNAISGASSSWCKSTALLGGGEEEAPDDQTPVGTSPVAPCASHAPRNTRIGHTASQPRLSLLGPSLTSTTSRGGNGEASQQTFSVEDDDDDAGSGTSDDDTLDGAEGAPAEADRPAPHADDTATQLAPTESPKKALLNPPELTRLPQPEKTVEALPSLSQLMCDVDDILGGSQRHADQRMAALSTPGTAAVSSHSLDAPQREEETDVLTTPTVDSGSHRKDKNSSDRTRTAPSSGSDAVPTDFDLPQSSCCVFCGLSPTAQHHQHAAPPLIAGDGHAYHLACALWCPEVYVDGATNRLCGVTEAVHQARGIRCALCCSAGAAVGCAASGCSLRYHLPCAVTAGALVSKAEFILYCPAHRLASKGGSKRQRDSDGEQPHAC